MFPNSGNLSYIGQVHRSPLSQEGLDSLELEKVTKHFWSLMTSLKKKVKTLKITLILKFYLLTGIYIPDLFRLISDMAG